MSSSHKVLSKTLNCSTSVTNNGCTEEPQHGETWKDIIMKIIITKHCHERMILRKITNDDIIKGIKLGINKMTTNHHGLLLTGKVNGLTLKMGVKNYIEGKTITIRTCMYKEVDGYKLNKMDKYNNYDGIKGYSFDIDL